MDERRRRRRQGRRKVWAVLAAFAVALPAVGALATPVAAQAQYLEVTKAAEPYQLAPGQTFTYSVQVQCSEQSCLDAQLTDTLPAELAGFRLQGVTTTPGESTVPRTVEWTEGGRPVAQPDVVGPDTRLVVDFTGDVTTPDGVGLQNGRTFTVQLALRVPDDLTPRELEIVNTARTTASNSLSGEASAPVRLSVPAVVDLAPTKTWGPSPQDFAPGSTSTVSLAVTSLSNVPLDALTLQEPADAPEGATALAASNPFTITDFTGFGAATVPAGTQVQVDAYVQDEAGAWRWVTGAPLPAPALPTGVDAADVAGLRFSYAGAVAPRDLAAVDLTLAQRATHRDGGADLSTAPSGVANVVTATATSLEHDRTVTKEAGARYDVVPAALAVTTEKNIEPRTVTGGESATGTLSATNTASPVAELRLADTGFFTADVTFGGFTQAPTWPAGATDAVVVYHPLAGGGPVEQPFARGETPAAPATPVSGFELVYTAPGNAIEEAATATASFVIGTTEAAAGEAARATLTNTVTTTATAANGTSATASDLDRLTVITPAVGVTLDKQVRPASPVEPGGTAFVTLRATGTATDRAVLHDIVLEDVLGTGDAEFWDAFDLVAVAPTQVPAGAVLTLEVRDGEAWTRVAGHGPQETATVFRLDRPDLAAALADAGAGDVTGVRLTFHSDAGFANDLTVEPVLVLDARSELRSGGPVDALEAEGTTQRPTDYVNTATVRAAGSSEGGTPLTDEDGDAAAGEVVALPGGPGALDVEKAWDTDAVHAQAADTAGTALHWHVSPGFAAVTLTDAATQAPTGTVYEAFDLRAVRPVAASSVPFSTGWYLRYDDVTAVELYTGGAWSALPVPAGGWVQQGRFVGHQLTAEQSAATTGVRLTLAENTAARQAAQQVGAAFDPYAPEPGSGVGAGSTIRRFDLDWQLRERTRTDDGAPGAWVTGQLGYNVTAGPGTVENTVALDGTRADGSTARDVDADTIQVLDPGPAVAVSKTVAAATPVFVPEQGTPVDRWPTATWTITAHNASVAAAGHVRVTDPATPCAAPAPVSACQTSDPDADPFGADVDWLEHSPFRYVDLTRVALSASRADEVDLDATVVWLLHHDGQAYTTSRHTGTAAAALDAAALADVVGVSVTFQAHDAGAAGVGTTITQANRLGLTLETRLRPTPRRTDEPLVLGVTRTLDLDNRVFAQSYDDVLSPGDTTGDLASARVVLTGGDVNIRPSKTVSPAQVLLADPDVPVTVTLAADQGTSPRSTLSPSRVVLEDHAASADFWDTVDLTGLGAVSLPAGADRVAVGVYGPFGPQGAPAWVDGAPAATAELPVPAEAYGDVQGIRFAFTRADGGYFDQAPPPAANWSARAAFTVAVRDTYRASGEDVVFTGSVANTVTAQSLRTDGKDSAPAPATARLTLSEGTRELEVNKLTNAGNRRANPGESVPFRITVTNAGTGFLTLTELRDTLPAELVHLGDAPTYTAQEGGLLSEDVTLAVSGPDLVLTWPEGGNRMAPGETFTIDLPLELQPAAGRVFNDVAVTTAEVLDRCGNTDGSGNWHQPGGDTSCATRDYVDAVAGPNLFAVKGVRGSLDGTSAGGAYHPGTGATCSPTLTATGGSYYRAPCVAHSELGGEDHWVLRVQNAGTFPVTSMTVFDQLPVAGDGFLVSGASRGSTYRPRLVADSLDVHAPDGTAVVVETTTSPDVCRGTWAGLSGGSAHTPCAQAGETWTPVGATTDWDAVTGLRVSLDFTATASGALTTRELVDVTFRTRNVVATAQDPSGAPAVVPADESFAWNQFGVQYRDVDPQGRHAVKRLAPNAVGVHLRTGSIAVAKEVTGPAAAYAAEDFTLALSCRNGDTPLDLGAGATVTLTAGEQVRLDGIPYGAGPQTECTVTETAQTGEFGETTRTTDPVDGVLTLTEPTDPTRAEQDVPAAQVATVTNDYRFTGLSVTKAVDTHATTGKLGPFDFTLRCTSLTGVPVPLGADGATTLAFTLADGETFTLPDDLLPVGTECLLTETDGSHADTVTVVGDNVTDHGDGSATVVPGVDPAEVTVVNGYGAGTLTVAKDVDGAGAGTYGDGPFGFTAECTYEGQVLLEETFELRGGETRSFGVFPAGTHCGVAETVTGGATTTTLEPADGIVEITQPAEADTVSEARVVATNTFDVGALEITKVVDGDGAELWGEGPFVAEVACSWDGRTQPVALPNDGVVTLTRENGYTARIDDLVVGAHCTVHETGTGGATSSTIAPLDGTVTVPPVEDGEPQAAAVTLTNTFDVTSLEVVKEVQGDLAGAQGPFEIELVCTREVDGRTAPVGIPGGAVRELSPADGLRTVYDRLPVGADCHLTETLTGGADGTTITVTVEGQEPVTTEGPSAAVQLPAGPGQARAVVVNAFDAVPVEPSPPADAVSGLVRTGAQVGALVGIAALLVALGAVVLRRRGSTP
ncbi:hypothetical protein FHE66_06400 [Georgenia sp. 311]|uniref:DUF5979 domain-containing protein n=1 Tax=Georgenia sp. 311 TaxID=2585134 RepID=UPI001111A43A|nr:DUF5979 domain-containing protein [Georgenia sp. 311]TNC18422.1 hypothetical protein FHE66_06400 [Georgenia sp. 311]